MPQMLLIPKAEFDRIRDSVKNMYERLSILADMSRLNALMAVKRAGSGHLGSSFSAMDIVVHLYHAVMNTVRVGFDHPERDVYFSSKGHDVPGLYAVLYSLGVLPVEKLLALRRFGGLDGHPDIGITGIESNSGSLGMGISKGRGMAWAKTYQGRGGCVFVMTGDGEWQEGQNFEALQGAAALKTGNLIVIVDHNKVQSDKPVDQIVTLGDLETKFRAFGWHVARCDGHDHKQLEHVMAGFREIHDGPKILIADTIKGRGVSFMEHPQALKDGAGCYKWHSGAPSDECFSRAYRELLERVNCRLMRLDVKSVKTLEVRPDGSVGPGIVLEGEPDSRGDAKPTLKSQADFVADAYGAALVDLAARHKNLVVLDADLSADCRVRPFELTYPDRFIECGIAEQDMVSVAGGLARQGLLPVVNSFASFLTSRANEQIYNNATEKTKILYVNHYAGLIPAGPGKSHQSIRDISLVGALPNMVVLQPGTPAETRMVLEYAVEKVAENCLIRLIIGPSPSRIDLPEDYVLTFGRGVSLTKGEDALLFAYGPVILNEAIAASDMLATKGIGLRVINMPWLNRVDDDWLASQVAPCRRIFVMEDHAPVGGLANFLMTRRAVEKCAITVWGVEGYPVCGTPVEALKAHRLDAATVAERIQCVLDKG